MATTSRATTLSVFLERKAAQQEAAMKADLAQRQRDIQEAIDNELESFYDSDSDSDNIDDVDNDNRANGNDELSESSLDVDAVVPPAPQPQSQPYYRHQPTVQHRRPDDIRPPIEDSSYIDEEPVNRAAQRHDDDDADDAIIGRENETNDMLLLAHNRHTDVDDDDDDDDEDDDVVENHEEEDDDEDENVAVREMPAPAGVIVGPPPGSHAYLQQLALLPSGHPARHLILPSEATSRSTAQLATISPETTGCGLSSAEYSSSGVQQTQELLLLGHNRNLNGHANILPPSMRQSQPYPAATAVVKQRGVDVGVSVVPDNQRDLDQLDILYRARGRHIEELKAQLTDLQESSAKEARLLKHKLALTEANRESAEKAATGVEERLKDSLQEIRCLKADSDKRQELTARLLTENEQLKRQVTEASCQNEALTAQLTEMTTAGTIGRVRDQQENFIQSLRNKKDEEIYYLKDRIDRLQAEAAERQADIDAAHALATKLRSQQSDQLIQANKLAASLSQQLQDSQRRCQDLLAAGADSEAAVALRQQLAQKDLAKAITEEMNSALQQEIVDLREQLAMYETAERLGALPPAKSSVLAGGASDGLAVSDASREATSTSMPNVGPTADRDKNVACLRAELLRCQALFKQKREKVTELQKELIQLKKASHEASLRCERAELALAEQREQAVAMETKLRSAAQKQQEAAVGAALEESSAEAARLQGLLKEANNRIAKLESELSAAQASLSESAEAQRQLFEQSDQLRSDFANAWERAEHEKSAEFERIQRTCQAHFDLCREKMREELLAGFAEERRATVDGYEARLADVQSLVTQLGQERRELEAKLAHTVRQLMKAEAEQPAAAVKVENRPVATQTAALLTSSVAVETRRLEPVNAAVQASPPPPMNLSLSTAAAAASSPVDPLAEQETELGRRLQQCYLAAISRIRDEVVGYMADSQERADRRLRRSQRSLCARFALHLRRNIEEKFGCPDAELSVDSVLQLLNQSLNHTMHRSLPSASHLTRRSELLNGDDCEDGDGDSTPTTSASRLSSPTMQQFLLPRQQQPPPPPPVAPRSSQSKQRSSAAVASAVATSTPAEKDAGAAAACN